MGMQTSTSFGPMRMVTYLSLVTCVVAVITCVIALAAKVDGVAVGAFIVTLISVSVPLVAESDAHRRRQDDGRGAKGL
jgi:hypothetical protein